MKNFLLINVLSKESYQDCHIKNSINIPLENIEDINKYIKNLNLDTPIIVYCASYACSASSIAWHKLKDMGFKNVKAYEGGIKEWYQNNLPVEGPCKLDYLKIKDLPIKEIRNIDIINLNELKKIIK